MDRTYVKALISGNTAYVRGYIEGFIGGRNLKSTIYFGEDLNLSVKETKGILAHFVGLEEEHSLVFLERFAFEILKEEISKGHISPAFEIIKMEPIEEAQFDFSIHTFSQETGGEIKALLDQYSHKVNITPTSSPVEKVIPEGKGIEAYAPLHDYEFLLKGRARGFPGDVFHLALKLNRYEVVVIENWHFTFRKHD